MEDLSLCGMFLMDEAKKVDRMFGVMQSSQHTTGDATSDIVKIAKYLLEEGVCKEDAEHHGDELQNPMVAGSKKVAGGHLDKYLTGEVDTDTHEHPGERGEIDFDYELYDVY